MLKKIKKNILINVKYYHKKNTLDIDNLLSNSDDSEEENIFNKNQRNKIKNKMILNNKEYINIKDMVSIKGEIKEEEKFIGKYEKFTNSKLCEYCEKYIDKKYFMSISPLDTEKTINYCIHCWAWLNYNDVKLSEGIYLGTLNQNLVFENIKKTASIHKNIGCTNQSCLFNEYVKLEKNNKLNIIFCEEIKEHNNKKNKENKIFTRDIQINWKKSSISI